MPSCDESSKKHCRNSSVCFSWPSTKFPRRLKEKHTRRQIGSRKRGASKTKPSRYWNTRWMLILAACVFSMLIQNSHELSFCSSTVIIDGIVLRFTHVYYHTEFLTEKCCILLVYWSVWTSVERNRHKIRKILIVGFHGSKFALCCALD